MSRSLNNAALLLTAASAALGVTMTTPAGAGPVFETIVVFGDSLSDMGHAGQFSNGPNWVEQLASRLGLALMPHQSGGSNFAIGGARLDPDSGSENLRAQMDRYLKQPAARGRALHVVYGGGNDVLGAIGRADARSAVDAAVRSLATILGDLVAHGATDILAPNLPDVGITPEVRGAGERAVAEARALTDQFNAGLDRILDGLRDSSNLRLHRLDVHAMAERARADPGAFGFADIARPCSGLPSCEGHLFWDRVHPTTAAHAHLADAAFRIVSADQR
jgi:outer membrane lipase/esterase